MTLAVGYAGEARRDVHLWMQIAGAQAWVIAASVLGGLIFAAARPSALTPRRVWIAVAPAMFGMIGAWMGWTMVLGSAERMPATERFQIFGIGLYEANACRFMGFAGAAALCAAAAAQSPGAGPRRDALAVAAGLAVLALAAAFLGAPSAALASGAAAIAALAGAGRGEDARASWALAIVLCALFASGAAFARIEAREGVLWAEQPDRVARAQEIVSAARERGATSAVAIAAAGAAAALAFARLRRGPREHLPRVTLAALGIMAAIDVAAYGRMLSAREGYREALARQFALLGRLEPPVAPALSPEVFAPRAAPGVQVTRQVIAVDREPIAAIGAVELDARLRGKLTEAIAHDLAQGREGGALISLTADRDVTFETLARVLAVARDAGVTRVDLLLARVAPPKLGPTDPPEAAEVVPSDFVALPAVIDASATPPPGDARWRDLAAAFATRAAAGERPLRLALPR